MPKIKKTLEEISKSIIQFKEKNNNNATKTPSLAQKIYTKIKDNSFDDAEIAFMGMEFECDFSILLNIMKYKLAKLKTARHEIIPSNFSASPMVTETKVTVHEEPLQLITVDFESKQIFFWVKTMGIKEKVGVIPTLSISSFPLSEVGKSIYAMEELI